tara:strand:+ start:9286 stop:11202 length:1917 start_codon:yes stop_codon:yes gene_type:complete
MALVYNMVVYDILDISNHSLLDGTEGIRVNWNRNLVKTKDVSLIDNIENDSKNIKKKYLSFIHDLGSKKNKNKSLSNLLVNRRGYNLWWMSLLAEKSYYKSPEIINCLKIIALEKILKEKKIRNLIFFSQNIILSRAVKLLCEEKNIQFDFKKIKNKSQNIEKDNYTLRNLFKKIYYFFPIFLQSIFWIINFWIRHSRLRLKTDETDFFLNQKSNFLFMSNFSHLSLSKIKKNLFYSYQWGDLNNLLKKLKIRSFWIHNYIRSQEVNSSLQAKEYLRKINKNQSYEHHLFLTCFINLRILFKVLVSLFYYFFYSIFIFQHIRNLKFNSTYSSSIIFLLRKDLKKSLFGSTLVENLIYIELFDLIMKKMPQKKLGIFLFENQSWEKAFIHAWQKYNHGKLIGYCHTTVNYWHLNYFEDIRTINSFAEFSQNKPDFLAVSGSIAKNNLIDFGYKKKKILSVESLRYSYLSKLIKKKSFSKKNKKILILGDHQTETTDVMLDSFKNLESSFKKKFKFYFKPYPANQSDYKNFKVKSLVRIDKPFNKIINDFYAIITSRSSAAALEAHFIGKKVIIFLEKNEINSSPLFGVKNVNYAVSENDLKNKILKLSKKSNKLNGSYFYINLSLIRWQKILNQYENKR